MFSTLRQNAPLYILDKGDEPSLKIGYIESVSNPTPKYPTTYTGGNLNFETVVTINAKVDDKILKFDQIPSNLSIANFGNSGIVISDDKVAMLSEIESMVNHSKNILNSIPYHEKLIHEAENMMRSLNPQLAKEKEQEEKISKLENKIGGIESTLSDMKDMLSEVLKPKTE